MKKTYKIKPNKKQLDIMKKYWKLYNECCEHFIDSIEDLETKMSKDCNIPEMEFFFPEGINCVGIGTVDRNMKLIHDMDLETHNK